MKLVHVTDTHLVPPGESLYGLDPADRLARVVARINRDHADADLCVLTGDLADAGAPAAYGALREILAGLRVSWRLLLGNHDRRDAFAVAFPEVERDPRGYVQSVLDGPAGRLIFLDTLVTGHGHGALDDGRLDWLAARLGEASDRPVLLFAHHPLAPIGMRHFEPISLVDPGPVASVLAEHGDVRHVFCGHVHVDAAGSWHGVPFSASRGTAHHIAPSLERADADFVARAPAFDVAVVGEAGVLTHRFAADDAPVIAHIPPLAPVAAS